MVGHHHILQSVALGNANGDAKHDAIAERHHGGAHVFVVVVALRNGIGAFEKARLEVFRHESQVDGDVGNAQLMAVHFSERYLAGVVVAAVVERNAQCNGVLVFVEHGDGVHAATDDDYFIFLYLSHFCVSILFDGFI